jgi:hypothetical protein
MKKLIFFSSAVLLCLSGFAKELGDSWVVVDQGKLECKRITIGYNKARIVLANGNKKTIQISDITSYAQYGKIYNKMPIYINNMPTGQKVFMELIRTRGNLSLYRYENPSLESINLSNKVSSYFVYNGDKMLLTADERSLPNIAEVFNVSFTYE